MSDSDGHFTIVFNGEIYNNQSLRSHLKSQNIPLKTSSSDTETILELFKLYDQIVFRMLSGMYAIAIYDSR